MSKESSQACEWVAAAALDSARERRAASSLRSSRAEEEEEEELVVDPVLAAAGMGQWCATMLHLIRTLSEELIPEAALLPHMERSESGGGDGGRRSGFISSVRQNTPLQLSEVIQLLQQQSVRGDGRRGESLIHCLTQLTVR